MEDKEVLSSISIPCRAVISWTPYTPYAVAQFLFSSSAALLVCFSINPFSSVASGLLSSTFGFSKPLTLVPVTNTAYQHKHLLPTVQHGGGGLMIWACSAATGPGHLAVIESTMNSSGYQSILESNVRPSV